MKINAQDALREHLLSIGYAVVGELRPPDNLYDKMPFSLEVFIKAEGSKLVVKMLLEWENFEWDLLVPAGIGEEG